MNTPLKITLSLLAALTVAGQTRAENIRGVAIDFVDVGAPNNAADTTTIKTAGAGDVAYPYSIGQYEVTARQWTDFLNLVDPTGTNAYGLFSVNMENNTVGMRINNNGTINGQRYAVTSGTNLPLVHVRWHMAARFCNYLTSGTTEAGPYVVSGTSLWPVDRAAAQATWQTVYVLPTLDEWYKAAYHKGSGSSGADYWDFPNQADVISQAMANYTGTAPTAVGTYPYPSAFLTYDQAGNVREWLETPYDATKYHYRGGSYDRPNDGELKSSGSGYQVPTGAGMNLGFRVARLAPAAGFVLPTPVHQSAFVNAAVPFFSPLPAFCVSFPEPQTGYTMARLGGTKDEMVGAVTIPGGNSLWDSDHSKHWYSQMPAINCNDTLAVSNGRRGIAAIWDIQTFKLLGWGPAVGSAAHPEATNTQRELVWDKLNPHKYYFCTQNRIMACTITRQAGPPATITTSVQQVYQFSGYDLVSFGDTKGDISRDNKRTTLVGKKNGVTDRLTVIAFNLDALTIQGTRDVLDQWNTANKPLRWEDFDGALVDPTGQFVVYDSGANGIFSLPWSEMPNATGWTHVTSAKRHGELVVGADGIPYWVRNSNTTGVMKHVLSVPNEAGVQVWSPAGSDGHMSGADQWPGKFIFTRYLDGGIYLLDLANPGYSYYLGNARHWKGVQGLPNSYGQQPRGSISASGRTILYSSDNGVKEPTSAAVVYGLKMFP